MIALVVGALVFIGATANRGTSPETSRPVITLDATTRANLTQMPRATPIQGAFADQIRALQTQINACPDYPPERLQIMTQYIDWLFAPNTIPREMVIAFSPDPPARLVFAMAADTSTEWRRKQRPPDSCLVPIGRALNELLVSFGQEPITVYDE